MGNGLAVLNFLAEDFSKDICVFATEDPLTMPTLGIRRYDNLRIGEPVFAIGNPSGLVKSISNGIVSGKRVINAIRVIQTNSEISGGSSGGGLFDQYGNLLGVTSFGLTNSEGLNFAIAIDEFIAEPLTD